MRNIPAEDGPQLFYVGETEPLVKLSAYRAQEAKRQGALDHIKALRGMIAELMFAGNQLRRDGGTPGQWNEAVAKVISQLNAGPICVKRSSSTLQVEDDTVFGVPEDCALGSCKGRVRPHRGRYICEDCGASYGDVHPELPR